MKAVLLGKFVSLKSQSWMLSLTFCCLLVLVSAVSCHDKPSEGISPCEANPENCKSVLESKDYFLFKQGSYWVYEEETTLERDSLYVTEYLNDESGYGFYIRVKSSLTDYEYRYWPTFYGNISGCNVDGTVTKRCLYVNRSKGKFQDNLGESIVYFVNNKIGESISTGAELNYCQDNHLTFASKYDSLLVAGNYFYKVVRVDQECEYAEGKQPTKFYYSKNIGIIRKELIDSNQVWNLVNYYVIQ